MKIYISSIGAIYKQRAKEPYKKNKTGLRDKAVFNLRGKAGVYMIYDKNSTLRYVGFSGYDVYKTMYRHFQSWNDPRQIRVTYPRFGGYKVRLIYCSTAKQAAKLEKALILKYSPPDNPNKYELDEMQPAEQKALREYLEENTAPIVTDFKDLPF